MPTSTDNLGGTINHMSKRILDKSASYASYMKSEYLSIKHSSYFPVYDELFSNFRDKDITFVEIGVLNGGSLFMWRDFFGPKARIIGIDFNPAAKRWESEGFEIFIGSQSDPEFWSRFYESVGSVDIILDDGGHTNKQQIVTTTSSINHINNGGILVVEDTHTSYMSDFGNPSKWSFIQYGKHLIDVISTRFSGLKSSKNSLTDSIHSVQFFESFVVFRIDRERCYLSEPTSNGGVTYEAEDVRHKDTILGHVNQFRSYVGSKTPRLKKVTSLVYSARFIFAVLAKVKFFLESRVIRKKYFK